VRERHLRKLQKDRHLAEIAFNLLSNPTFKNLSRRERGQLAKLIYKAELLEVELRSKDTTRVMNAFKDLINGINIQILEASDEDDENFDENDDFPPRY
jgi:predicted secreted Zn-dependent protease